jgi:Protein of unknown function (DUF707)
VLDFERVQDRCWRFGIDGVMTHAPFLRLTRDGRITGYLNPNEYSWTIREGRLVLADDAGRASTLFDQCAVGEGGLLVLKGSFRDGGIVHVLEEIVADGDPVSPDPSVRLIQRRPAGSRRNLVVLRANENSLHLLWKQDLLESERSWDLCNSFYGKAENFPPDDFAEYAVLQNRDRKFTALKKLMHADSVLWDYDYVMFPDDDLDMSWRDVNVVFAVCREYGLQLAQPSLDPRGFVNYLTTRQNPSYLLRFVSMVEVMTPIFSRQALRTCIHSFDLTASSFGVDYVWSKLVQGPQTKIAIIDKVAVRHTRPTGHNYDIQGAFAEGRALSARYGARDHFVINERGGIFA